MNEQLTPRQLMILVAYFIIGTTILVVPSALAAEAKQSAWILQLAGTGSGLMLIALYVQVFKRNANSNLFQINERLFGRWIGKGISLTIALLVFVFCAQVLYYIGRFVTTQIMPDTPSEAIHVLFIITVVVGMRMGIPSIARTAEIYFPWVLLLFIFFILFIMPDIRVNQLLPAGEFESMSLVRGALQVMSYSFLPMFVTFASLNAAYDWRSSMAKAFVYGTLLSGVMLTVLVMVSTMVLGPDNTTTQLYPTYVVARKINVGNFLQRVEVIVAFLWFILIFIKLILYFDVVIMGIAETFRITKHAKTLTVPVGLLIAIFSAVVYPDYVYQQEWDNTTWVAVALLIGLAYPIALLFLSLFRKRKAAAK
ncbi:GerAB/ArcD/ProY family transporter [Paenibacillus methanolicus]|uniref:Spore germination protein KB n=1 Tax=Paenibacillus methanolicus TaxID=582686 RepID=A0A5S5C8C2_9BACL|nr:endospore germination permease [Paenibacillus methanolicus]TYP74732.1 spore germination protein KB [Paenibacillus methanolicus]